VKLPVRGDVEEKADLGFPGRIQEHPRALHIRSDEIIRLLDGTIHVRFGGEVDDHLRPVGLQGFVHHLLVTDVAADEDVAPVALEIGQVAGVPGVGQLVEVHDTDGRVGEEDVANEVRPNEAHAARDQERSRQLAHGSSRIRNSQPPRRQERQKNSSFTGNR
jgi:hypothetical protein